MLCEAEFARSFALQAYFTAAVFFFFFLPTKSFPTYSTGEHLRGREIIVRVVGKLYETPPFA